MNARIALLAAAAGALLLSACSLLLNFNPEGQPCDADGECLEGYGCVDGACREGAPAGIDCSQCPAGACTEDGKSCLPHDCTTRVCPATYWCDDSSGFPECRTYRQEELGANCFDDTGCTPYGANRVCMRGAVQTQASGGGLRNGVCVEPCGEGDTCQTPNAVCRSFDLGMGTGVTKVCLPERTLTPCVNDTVCARGDLICTVFDHPDIGALTACDSPLTSGAAPGEVCVASTVGSDGGTLCRNGLCVPESPVGDRLSNCGSPCDSAEDCVGGTCALVEFELVGVVRQVPMCVGAPTLCSSCESDSAVCGADAPHCTTWNGEQRCLSSCSADAGSGSACPTGYTCSDLGVGFRCVPEAGACQ